MTLYLRKYVKRNMRHCEIDLHGLTWSESLEEFISTYNGLFGEQSDSDSIEIRVIHGYGSSGRGGSLRRRLRGFLSRQRNHLEFAPGEEVDGNKGLTIVSPVQRLPDMNGLLGEQILEYCMRPKSSSKVIGKFRKHGQPMIMGAVKMLQKQGLLQKKKKGKLTLYQSK